MLSKPDRFSEPVRLPCARRGYQYEHTLVLTHSPPTRRRGPNHVDYTRLLVVVVDTSKIIHSPLNRDVLAFAANQEGRRGLWVGVGIWNSIANKVARVNGYDSGGNLASYHNGMHNYAAPFVLSHEVAHLLDIGSAGYMMGGHHGVRCDNLLSVPGNAYPDCPPPLGSTARSNPDYYERTWGVKRIQDQQAADMRRQSGGSAPFVRTLFFR